MSQQRSLSRLPSYRLHRPTGQAVVTLDGRDIYLGAHRTKASQDAYDRLIAEWIAHGRHLPPRFGERLTVVEVCNAYRRFAQGHYRRDGQVTKTYDFVVMVLKMLGQSAWGRTPAEEFGPMALKAFRQGLLANSPARTYVNKIVGIIKQAFRWAVSEEMIPPVVYQGLASVTGLQQGRSQARETSPILPVEDHVVEATLPYLSSTLADMVRLQRLTGMRPGEVCQLRPGDVSITTEPWQYRPEQHKTKHHGRERIIFLGPRAQDVLRPYLLRPEEAYCFSPAEVVSKRAHERHAKRTVPLSCGNKPGSNRKTKPKRQPGERYDSHAFGAAITRAIKTANRERQKVDPSTELLPNWHPNQLRHLVATEIRRQFGLEAAQVALGHSRADVTQIYAERDMTKAADVIRMFG